MASWKYFIRDSSDAPLENPYFTWAREQFGNINDTRWNANFQGYWFAKKEDVTMFLLKWGSHRNLSELHVDESVDEI